MANNKTNATENEVYDYYMRPGTGVPARPSTVYFALFSSDPGETQDMSGELATADGYARQLVTMSAPTDGAGSNTIAVQFGPASANWPQATHGGFCKAGVRGVQDVTYHAPLAVPRTILVNQVMDFGIGAITNAEL